MSSGILPHAKQSGRNDLCVVQYQTVSRLQIINNLPKNMMRYLTAILVQHQESGGRTILQGILGDQFLGQFKIKI